MIHQLGGSPKKNRQKEREDWMWYEDPYKTTTTNWHSSLLKSHDVDVPAPSPTFGTGPTVHDSH